MLIFTLVCGLLKSQTANGNLKHRFVNASHDTLVLDTFQIAFKSVEIYLDRVKLHQGYTVIYERGLLITDSSLRHKNLEVYYRVLNLKDKVFYYRKSRELIEPAFSQQPRAFYNYRQDRSTTELIFGDGLNVAGNIARGIGFGNNQDIVLNSNLNLQLNGKLGKGISIQAAISDENNPIQPQGNTQQIQDFDRVYVSIFKDSSSLTVGDFLMNTDKDQYFMKYYKKSRGLKLDIHTGKKVQHTLRSNAAISRGKFVRNEIQGQEGIQGPYRLQGANGEFNIIVISGTEMVYIDGEKLERGQQNDYIIDYNTGEVMFMPGRLINRYNRIVVEFQYSDRNYARSVFTVSDAIRSGRWRGSVNYFTEQDNRLQPTDTSNNSEIQTILENSGDKPAIYNFERNFEQFQTDRVNYRKIDSLGFPIYIFTNDPLSDTAFYAVTFSLVGKGKGNYVQIATSANGRVFAWVQPINGIPAGEYEPYIELVAPKRLQMLTANAAYSSGEKFEVKIEGAYSNNNINTFSVLDKRNDDGLGLFFSLKQKDFQFRSLKIGTNMKVEYINSNFRYVERYRAVEFNRIWNRQLGNTLQSGNSDELISSLGTVLDFREKHKLIVEASNFRKGSIFDGLRGLGSYSYTGRRLLFTMHGEKLGTSGKNTAVSNRNQSSLFNSEAVYQFEKIRFGLNGRFEESRFTTDTGQGLEIQSFKYEQVSAFMESVLHEHWKYKLDADYRTDYIPESGSLTYVSTGTNINSLLEYSGKKFNQFKFVGSYRMLNQIGKTGDEEVILSRVEYNASIFKKVINSSTYYQIGTGREQKRQFSFIEVQAGNGTHTWIDYNDNKIEEINEFEPSVFKDQARYVKVFLPSNEFIKSNSNEFNQTFRIQAPMQWQSGNRVKRFISRFNTITAYRADRRITDNRLETILNPFKLNISDSSLISVSSLIKQTTFFNRSNARFGLEHNVQTNKGKQFLNSGFEWRQNDKQQLISRIGFSRRLNLVLDGEVSRKQNRNEFFENRNYNYSSKILHPELFYQTLKGIRVGAYHKYTEAINEPEFGNDQAYLHETGVEIRYFIINKGNFDAKLASHTIRFTGNANSPLAFDILNGLSNGKNLTWSIGFGGKTKGNIQVNLSYEGRKTEVFKTIHIGRAEARYIF